MDNLIDELADMVLSKKEISGIDRSLVIKTIKDKMLSAGVSKRFLHVKDKKLMAKIVREELRNLSGRFQNVSDSRKDMSFDDPEKILFSHSSSKERMEDYPWLKKLIKSLKVNSILDLGCGLNPLALANTVDVYDACDIKSDELEIIKKFFLKNNVSGNVFVCDLREEGISFQRHDLVLILKVLDIIEKRGHKLAEKIISSLDAAYILASFPTKTISGKAMNHPQRGWIERMLNRLGYNFEVYKKRNEIYYLIRKSSEK